MSNLIHQMKATRVVIDSLSGFELEEQKLIHTQSTYLEMVIPGYSETLILQVRAFMEHRNVVGIIGLLGMLFFSSLAFSMTVVTLLSIEAVTVILLLGAQVIAELDRKPEDKNTSKKVRTLGVKDVGTRKPEDTLMNDKPKCDLRRTEV